MCLESIFVLALSGFVMWLGFDPLIRPMQEVFCDPSSMVLATRQSWQTLIDYLRTAASAALVANWRFNVCVLLHKRLLFCWCTIYVDC